MEGFIIVAIIFGLIVLFCILLTPTEPKEDPIEVDGIYYYKEEPKEETVQVQNKFDYTGYAIEYHPYKDSYYIVRTNNGKFKYLCEDDEDDYDFSECIYSDVFEFSSISNAMHKLNIYLETVDKQGVTIIEIK